MHQTTTTNISDMITTLNELDDKLNQASFTPTEELLGILVAGSLVLNSVAEKTLKTQFTDDEVTFIESLATRIEENLQDIYADNEANGWDSYEDNNNGNRDDWEHPEWDN